jgi:uncharacterized protein
VKVWLDFANSPHPLLFAPIARCLEELGHEVVVTARDSAQTLELARERFPAVVPVGARSPSGRRAKAAAIAGRARALRRWARTTRPDLALSHNSYAQIVAARSLSIRAVTAMDYEHQPANHVAFRLADRILLPAVVPAHIVRRQGAARRKVLRYDGLKEEIYLGDFEPDADVLEHVGIERVPDVAVVVVRAPPASAMYHQFDSPLYVPVLERLAEQGDVRAVVLSRHLEQRRLLAELALPNVVVPEAAVDARSLMYAADLVVGAGGTMTREAALLGVPSVSIFAGRPPAVDLLLERRSQLRRIAAASDLDRVERRAGEPRSVAELRGRSRQLTRLFIDIALAGSP